MSGSKNENIWDGILSDVESMSGDDDDVTGKPRIPVPEPPPSTSGVEAQSISGASSTGSGKLATPRGAGITPAIPNVTGTEMPPPSTVSIATAPPSTAGTAFATSASRYDKEPIDYDRIWQEEHAPGYTKTTLQSRYQPVGFGSMEMPPDTMRDSTIASERDTYWRQHARVTNIQNGGQPYPIGEEHYNKQRCVLVWNTRFNNRAPIGPQNWRYESMCLKCQIEEKDECPHVEPILRHFQQRDPQDSAADDPMWLQFFKNHSSLSPAMRAGSRYAEVFDTDTRTGNLVLAGPHEGKTLGHPMYSHTMHELKVMWDLRWILWHKRRGVLPEKWAKNEDGLLFHFFRGETPDSHDLDVIDEILGLI